MLNRFSAAMIAARHTGRVARGETLESQAGKQAVGSADGWGCLWTISTGGPQHRETYCVCGQQFEHVIQEGAQIAPLSQATDLDIQAELKLHPRKTQEGGMKRSGGN